ncbi:MMPL family transporter [Actinoplanes sp. TBRC 11911]|uniref:MMPL family transporter n=1 Tax=Actinoplanes sp. TBRC 11911 TaxID=2729386 RepID=UPI00145C6642|nr:MMPL family transporter [Actinoplanes sp. TBRC 11911]NMO51629.1 MMPL family transporter [Actinoplanes sp. TBRC 11911]
MNGLSAFVLRHKLAVTLAWLVVFLAGAATAGRLSGALDQDFTFPGTDADRANRAVLTAYGAGGTEYPLVPVVTLPAGTPPDATRDAFAAAAQADPSVRVVSYPSTKDNRFLGSDGRTQFALVFVPSAGHGPGKGAGVTAAIQTALPPGSTVHVTGIGALNTGGNTGSGTSVLTETLLGGLGALAVLAFVFASLLALLPLLIAAVSILTTFLVVLALTAITDVSVIVQFLVALIGLGVAIDYSLLLATRWREEQAHGHRGDEAIHRAMAHAGRAVLLSGVTVAIGLLALVVLPVPFLRSVGIGGMLIPLISVLATLTLLPVLLARFGQRLLWPRIRSDRSASRAWRAWASGVVRLRWLAVVAALAILGALTFTATGMRLGEAGSAAVAQAAPPAAAQGLRELTDAGIPSGVLTPMLSLGTPPPVDGTYATVTTGPLTIVLPVDEASTDAGKATIQRVRGSTDALIGGPGVLEVDAEHALYQPFPYLLAAISLITFVLLARAFRSLLLAAKAIVLNLLSMVATYGVVVIVWQHGHGSDAIWGIPATGAVTFWLPVMTFAFLFGLSMDYEVFILARTREEYDRSGDTRTAIVEGIGRTGRLVTSAALILFLAFVSLATAPETDVKMLATALGAGILLDATVVRSLLVPATVSLFGKWNWWLPGWAARVLRVPPATPATPSPRVLEPV